MKVKNFLAFIYAFTRKLTVDIGGQLFVAELIGLLYFPFIKKKRLFRTIPEIKYIFKCLLFLLLAQMLSDFVNGSEPIDFIRGWALIIFSGISTFFLTDLFSRSPRAALFFLIGTFFTALFFSDRDLDFSLQAENTNYFKLRIVGFLNTGIMIVSYYLMRANKKTYIVSLFFIYFIINFLLDARSNGLIFLLAAILLFLKFNSINITKKTFLKIGLVSLPFFYGAYCFYVDQVLNYGFGGANSKNQLQMASNPYNPFELLLHGRAEFYVLFEAVIDKPLFGYGSWGKDPHGKFLELYRSISGLNVEEYGYIKAHSIVMGFWAYAGFAGFLSIIFLYIRLIRLYIHYYNTTIYSLWLPVLTLMFFQAIWAFLFSPIQDLRISFPVFIALLTTEIYNKKRL